MPARTKYDSSVDQVLATPSSSNVYMPSPGKPFTAWVLAGSWSGPLYLEKSPDMGTTWVPIELNGVRIYSASTVSCFTVVETGSDVMWRWTAGVGFSGTATVRLSQ